MSGNSPQATSPPASWPGGFSYFISTVSTRAQSTIPTLKAQEIALDHADSVWMFQPGATKPFVATPAALALYGEGIIIACLRHLQILAESHHGLDHLQVFTDFAKSEALWFIEDSDGGAITALLPSDY